MSTELQYDCFSSCLFCHTLCLQTEGYGDNTPISMLLQVFCDHTCNAVNVNTYLSSNKVLVMRAGINQILVRIANKEDPDQTASSEAV